MELDQECMSNEGWWGVLIQSKSDPDLYHSVTINPWDRNLEGAICDCTGYEFRGTCSHQQQALDMICGWKTGDKKQTAEQKRTHECPSCGGKTRTVI